MVALISAAGRVKVGSQIVEADFAGLVDDAHHAADGRAEGGLLRPWVFGFLGFAMEQGQGIPESGPENPQIAAANDRMAVGEKGFLSDPQAGKPGPTKKRDERAELNL